MALTPTQKATIKNLYTAITTPLKAKYGASLVLESIHFPTDDTGAVNGMEVSVSIETPPDPDGEKTRMRKTLNLW